MSDVLNTSEPVAYPKRPRIPTLSRAAPSVTRHCDFLCLGNVLAVRTVVAPPGSRPSSRVVATCKQRANFASPTAARRCRGEAGTHSAPRPQSQRHQRHCCGLRSCNSQRALRSMPWGSCIGLAISGVPLTPARPWTLRLEGWPIVLWRRSREPDSLRALPGTGPPFPQAQQIRTVLAARGAGTDALRVAVWPGGRGEGSRGRVRARRDSQDARAVSTLAGRASVLVATETGALARSHELAGRMAATECQCRCHGWRPGPGRFAGESETRCAFHAHELPKREAAERSAWRPGPGRFAGLSETREEFHAHPLPEREAAERAEWTPGPGRFAGESESRGAFRPHELPEREAAERAAWRPGPGRFGGMSETRAEFHAHPLPEREAAEAAAWRPGPGHFSGESEAKGAFRAHPLPEREAADRATWRPGPGRFGGLSETQAEFHPHPLPEREPAARTEWTPGPGRFAGESEARCAFHAHTLPEREAAERAAWRPRPGRFAGESETRAEFHAHPLPEREYCCICAREKQLAS